MKNSTQQSSRQQPTIDPHQPVVSLRAMWHKLWHFNRPLAVVTALQVLLIPFLFMGMIMDPKMITGVNGWFKPLKFAISGTIYAVTLAWFLAHVHGRRRLVQIAAFVTAVALFAEMVLIVMQVVRGVGCHFNVSTPLDATVFSLMGLFILLLALMNLLVGILLIFQRMDDRVFVWALRFGILITFGGGMIVGSLMTAGPTPEQIALVEAGQDMLTVGAHSVGVADGGAGLPFVGWSTEGGDLRIPHFFGLHAMQILPLLGWLLTRRRARQLWQRGQRLALVWTAGIGYGSWVWLLTWQALRGQSIVAPDSVTGLAYAALIGGVTLAIATIMVPKRPSIATNDALTIPR